MCDFNVHLSENGYIGLSPLTHHRKHADSNEEQHSSVISSYLRPLANFIVPKSQIKLIEILGKGAPYINNTYTLSHVLLYTR